MLNQYYDFVFDEYVLLWIATVGFENFFVHLAGIVQTFCLVFFSIIGNLKSDFCFLKTKPHYCEKIAQVL